MRSLALAILFVLAFCWNGFAASDLSGHWVIDLQASDSPEEMLKRLGAGLIQRKFALSTKIEATYRFSALRLTIETHAPAFSRTEELRLDGQPENLNEELTGPYTIVSRWNPSKQKLTSISRFVTKDGKAAELTVSRELADKGASLILTQTLKVDGNEWLVHRIFRRLPAKP